MLSRRRFFAAGVSATAALGSIRLGLAQGPLLTRRSVHSMSPGDPDLVAYSRGVAMMKALPATDPRNWLRFAEIHNNYCSHQNWYFLPWHRAYLASLEGIIRALTGKADFALPYWDWTKNRQLPEAFTAGNPNSNPLNHPRPGFPAGQSLPDDMVGPDVVARILNSPDFEAFGSTRPTGQNNSDPRWQRRNGASTDLESNPHNGVHGMLGGDMGDTERAARDPIFYLHHANVDRLWFTWNRRGNENSRLPYWENFAFKRNFLQPDGTAWDVTVGGVQNTAALGYQYEPETVGFQPSSGLDAFAAVKADAANNALARRLSVYRQLQEADFPRTPREVRRIILPSAGTIHMAFSDNEQAASRERPVSIPVALGRSLPEMISPSAISAATLSTPGDQSVRQCVWAMIRGIAPPKDARTRVHVFVNCGDLSANTDVGNPHYATSFGFFGGEHSGHSHGYGMSEGCSMAVDVTAALSRICQTQSFKTDKLAVQLLPICEKANAASTQCKPRRVDIVII